MKIVKNILNKLLDFLAVKFANQSLRQYVKRRHGNKSVKYPESILGACLFFLFCSWFAYFCSSIFIPDLYMRFISYDVVECEVNNEYMYLKNRPWNTYSFSYIYKGKLYNGSDGVMKGNIVSKTILNGRTINPLYVCPINPEYTSLEKPSVNTVNDWFRIIVGFVFPGFFIFMSIFSLINLKRVIFDVE